MSKALIKYVPLLILVLCCTGSQLSANAVQDSKINPYMLLTYLKDTDSRKILQVKMTNITQVGEVPLPGLNVRFYNNETLLGEATTDAEGNASCTIGSTLLLFTSEDGCSGLQKPVVNPRTKVDGYHPRCYASGCLGPLYLCNYQPFQNKERRSEKQEIIIF